MSFTKFMCALLIAILTTFLLIGVGYALSELDKYKDKSDDNDEYFDIETIED